MYRILKNEFRATWAFIALMFMVSCEKHSGDSGEKARKESAAPDQTTNTPRDAYLSLVQTIGSKETSALQKIMHPQVSCCGMSPMDCANQYFIFDSSSNLKPDNSKLIELIKIGYAVVTKGADTLIRIPRYYPPEKGEVGFDSSLAEFYCPLGFCMYITADSVDLYEDADLNSNFSQVAGRQYVKRTDKVNCHEYSKFWDIDCEWEKIETIDRKTGWIKRGNGQSLDYLRIEMKKIGGKWLITHMSTMGCSAPGDRMLDETGDTEVEGE